MNKLDFSVSLRAKGLSKAEIRNEMVKKGFEQSEIDYYLKKSDEIFLDQYTSHKKSTKHTKTNHGYKTVILILCLVVLVGVFYGYAALGLIGLFVIYKLIRFGSS